MIVSEKIKKELLPKSPLLADEIDSFKDNQNEIEVVFKNGSSIVVVAANENARGYRATVMIYEEFRMIAKNIIDSVLSPFLYVRQTDYLKQEEYAGMQEEPKRGLYQLRMVSEPLDVELDKDLYKRYVVWWYFMCHRYGLQHCTQT